MMQAPPSAAGWTGRRDGRRRVGPRRAPRATRLAAPASRRGARSNGRGRARALVGCRTNARTTRSTLDTDGGRRARRTRRSRCSTRRRWRSVTTRRPRSRPWPRRAAPSLGDLAQIDQHPTLADPREGDEFAMREAGADLAGLDELGVRTGDVARLEQPHHRPVRTRGSPARRSRCPRRPRGGRSGRSIPAAAEVALEARGPGRVASRSTRPGVPRPRRCTAGGRAPSRRSPPRRDR